MMRRVWIPPTKCHSHIQSCYLTGRLSYTEKPTYSYVKKLIHPNCTMKCKDMVKLQ